MSRYRSLDAISSYLGAQPNKPAPEDPTRPGRAAPFVTLSRQAGAGGTTVAECLAEILNRGSPVIPWTVFDRGLVERVLEEHGLPESFDRFFREDCVTELASIAEDLFGTEPRSRSLIRKTSGTILRLAMMGHAILVGRAANVVTASQRGGVHVRLVGSPGRRLERVMEFYDLDEAAAADLLREKDRGRENYVRRTFKADIDDPTLYDLVLNTDRRSYEAAAEVIAALL